MAKRKLPAKLIENVAKELGRRGGKARAKKLSPEQRREIARQAVLARWRKKRKKAGPPAS